MAEVAGCTTKPVIGLSDEGVFPGVGPGLGHEHWRTYGLMDALALTVGIRHRDIGVPHPWVKAIVRVVARLAPQDVGRAVDEGRTLVVPLPGQPGVGLLLEPDPGRPTPPGLLLDDALRHVLK